MSSITAKKLTTIALVAIGVWYLMPEWHAKWNIESHFGKSFSASTVRNIGGVLLLAGIFFNSQVDYTVIRIKALDVLSRQRRENFKAISNFCNLVSDMDASIAQNGPAAMPVAGQDF